MPSTAPLRDRRALLLVAAGALVFRLLPLPARYLELDSAIYLRAAADYAAALRSGALLTQPLTGQHYAAVDYWPPLYPMLSGLAAAAGLGAEAGAVLVAGLAGWLALFPAAFLAWRWWGPRAGLVAAFLVGFSPILAWYARVPRSESLFLLLYLASLAGLLASRTAAGALLGGACLGLAYATRFDALLLVPGALAAAWFQGEPGRARRLGLWVLGLGLAAAPYLAYLAWLNGGTPTLIAPKKAVYDTLEGLWATTPGRDMASFTEQFGPPGLTRLDPADPQVQALFATQVDRGLPSLLLGGLQGLPRSLAQASVNLMPLLLLPALLALAADRRTRPLLALYAPFPFYAMLTSWDPNSRYYACLAVPTLLLAARGLDLLFRGEAPERLRPALPWLGLALAAASWWLPRDHHFDTRVPVDPGLLAGAGPAWLGPAAAALGVAVAAAVGTRRPPTVAGLAGSAAALALVLSQVRFLPGLALGPPLDLVGLALLPAVLGAFLPRPGPAWQPAMARWLLAAALLLGLQGAATLALQDLAAARLNQCPGVARWLEGHPEVRTVASAANVDVYRTGREWVPVPVWPELDRDLPRLRPDAVLVSVPDGPDLDPRMGLSIVARAEGTGLYRQVQAVPAPGPGGREWRILLRTDL